MPSNDPSGSNAIIPPGADDFTRIRGISPKIANRLYEVGILTYTKLGAMSPDEIVARIGSLSGVSAESIAKKDWIGQSRRLASPTEQAPEISVVTAAPHRADFAVKLQLNADNTVNQTHVMHMQSGGEEIWDGWIDEHLITFIAQRANLSLSGAEEKAAAIVETATPVVSKETPEEATPDGAAGLIGQARIQELVTVPAHGSQPSRALSSGQPFDVRLLLDLSEVRSPEDTPLNYIATIYAKRLDAQGIQKVGEAQGTAQSTQKVTLKFDGAELPHGVYRLQATVTLTQQAKPNEPLASPQYLDGGLLQVR